MVDDRVALHRASLVIISSSSNVTNDNNNLNAAPVGPTRLDPSLPSVHLAMGSGRCDFERDCFIFNGWIWFGCRGIEFWRETQRNIT